MKTISSWQPRSTGFSNGRTISRSYRRIRGHPPTILTNGPPTGAYRVLVDPNHGTSGFISRVDVPEFLVAHIDDASLLHKTLALRADARKGRRREEYEPPGNSNRQTAGSRTEHYGKARRLETCRYGIHGVTNSRRFRNKGERPWLGGR